MHASPFEFAYLPFFRELLYDAHQSAMAEDHENRKRPNKRTPTSAKKMHKVTLGDHTFVTR